MCSHAGTGPHGGMQECFYPGGLENPEREQRECRGEPGAGGGSKGWGRGCHRWQVLAGRAHPKGTAVPSPPGFPELQALAKLLHSPAAFWCFVPRKVSQRMLIPSPSIILHPAEPGLRLLPWSCLLGSA